MKRPVIISTYSIVMSCIGIVILGGLSIYEYTHGYIFRSAYIGAALLIMCLFTIIYMPLSVSVDNQYLSVRRPLRRKKIPLAQIESINPCPPTMAERRICGSGGWFGYWGWFSQRDIGKYFAYYGKASDCFLVTLKNGKKYMLGCKDPKDILDFISNKISSSTTHN